MDDFAPTGPCGERTGFSQEEHHQHMLRTIPVPMPLPGYAGETQAPLSSRKVRGHPLPCCRRKGSCKVDLIVIF